MLQTLMVKLNPSKEQHKSLLNTMTIFNQACNYISEIAFANKCANKITLQKLVYYDVREQFKLSAQLTIRAIAKVVEAYKRDKTIQPKFKSTGAIVYDQRILSWKGLEKVSMSTIDGRLKIPIIIGEYQKARLNRIRGQADLIIRKGIFYLLVIIDVPEAIETKPIDVIGIDLGINNIAVDSTNKMYTGDKVKEIRTKRRNLRSRLQSRGTKSAKKHLKKLSGKERRFMTNVNHIISKELVIKAKRHLSAIALENLKGIRNKTTAKKAQRYYHSSWAFNQLRKFIEYKAQIVGIPTITVSPRNTSITCPSCGFIDKRNRIRNEFKCIQCAFVGHADYIGAINIRTKGIVNCLNVSANHV